MIKEKILVIDDEPEISDLIKKYLIREGYQVSVSGNGQQALQHVISYNPDLIILDILLPDLNGIEVCQLIRQHTYTPIIFISCKDEDSDKVLGLGVGGDDYLTKPFSPSELVARVNAHLRRSKQITISNTFKRPLAYKDLNIDPQNYSVTSSNKPISLTAKEFELLYLLARNPKQVFSANQIFDVIWNEGSLGDTRTVLVHISNLRKKIEPDPQNPEYLITVRGLGYKFGE